LPFDTGIIIPKTKDGRLIYLINYLGHTMVGTTDVKCDVTHHCKPDQSEIDFIISELKPYFGENYDYKANMMAAFAGIRPLVTKAEVKEKT
jgi:glycerol-3-phosphate dehydrogenase